MGTQGWYLVFVCIPQERVWMRAERYYMVIGYIVFS